MKSKLSFLPVFILLCFNHLIAQSDSFILFGGNQQFRGKSVEYIADQLSQNRTSDREKARAIYSWVAQNVDYDFSKTTATDEFVYSNQIINNVLQTRRGVCMHYSRLFQEIALAAGLECFFIQGYTRFPDGRLAPISHAWNAIRSKGEIFFIDATWGSGYQTNGKYVSDFNEDHFWISKNEIIKTHMPFDMMWQFSSRPISFESFEEMQFSNFDEGGNFNYSDTIKKHASLGQLEKWEGSLRRIKAFRTTNELIQGKIDFLKFNIDGKKFNLAIERFNKGINAYNNYISHKNKQFKNPPLNDDEVSALLKKAEMDIYGARKAIRSIKDPDPQLQDVIRQNESDWPELKAMLEKEQAFIKKYLSTQGTERKMLFYKVVR